jgi:hypothetical protein
MAVICEKLRHPLLLCLRHNAFEIGKENVFGHFVEHGIQDGISFELTLRTKHRTSTSRQLQLLLQIPLFTPE